MVRIRLRRVGKKKQPSYRVVVADQRSPRDGRFIEIIGHYDPLTDPPTVVIKEDRALYWLSEGAQPSDPVARMLRNMGIWDKFLGAGAEAESGVEAETEAEASEGELEVEVELEAEVSEGESEVEVESEAEASEGESEVEVESEAQASEGELEVEVESEAQAAQPAPEDEPQADGVDA